MKLKNIKKQIKKNKKIRTKFLLKTQVLMLSIFKKIEFQKME